MRQKQRVILPGFFHNGENSTHENFIKVPQAVLQYREEYRRIDEQLQKYPEILEAVHRDLKKLCKPDPTDSSLLWDTYRTIDRIWTRAIDLGLSPILPAFRFHPEKIRDLHLDITRFATSKDGRRKQLVKSSYKTLIERTGGGTSP